MQAWSRYASVALVAVIVSGCAAAQPGNAVPAPTADTSRQTEPMPQRDPLLLPLQEQVQLYEQALATKTGHVNTDTVLQLSSLETNQASVVALFSVQTKTRLAYQSPDQSPVVQGDLRYLRDHAAELTGEQLAWCNTFMASYRQGLQNEIDHERPGTDMVKVLADLDSTGRVKSETIRVMVQRDANGGHGVAYIPAGELLASFTTPKELEEEAYTGFGKLIIAATSKSK